ncbi:hypothetical protein G4P69_04910 [Aetokthonos hydrillicola CCALA 1050]|nr:hypothetical protein [Aetokthonos hydrillicola CCALA 1050]
MPDLSKFLIPRSQQRKFLIKFTIMTILGWAVGGIASLTLEKTLLHGFSPTVGQQLTWYKTERYLSNGLFAVIFAADQAFVMHRYISGWLWALATSIGWLIANGISAAWISHISSMVSTLNKNLSPHEIFFFGILSTCAYIISGIWLGFFQWLILRRYTVGSWWWNFLPSFSFSLISISIGFLSLIQQFIPLVYRDQILYFFGQGLTAVILGVIPGIGLCTLKKNSSNQKN